MRKRDLVAFLADNPGLKPNKIQGFLRFLSGDQPFRDGRGRPPSNQGKQPRQLTPPQVVPPAVLKDLIAQIQRTRSAAEFVLAWLVCRMAMTAKAAYGLTLDNVRLNDKERLVIRPARIWVTVPSAVATPFLNLILELLECRGGRL